MTTLLNKPIEKLKTHVKAHVVLPDDPNYDEVRQIWNARIDRKPAVIVQCVQADDVANAIALARANKLELFVRGGGHNIAGTAVCDDGVTIDIQWARAFFQASAPYASAGAYVNFMTEDEGERVAAVYGANYDRLVQIKRRYDPENIFHLNQNIKP